MSYADSIREALDFDARNRRMSPMTATNRRSRAIDILALRVASDIIENPVTDTEQEVPLNQIVFYTADNYDMLGLDLFDDNTLTELTDRVQGLLRYLAT